MFISLSKQCNTYSSKTHSCTMYRLTRMKQRETLQLLQHRLANILMSTLSTSQTRY